MLHRVKSKVLAAREYHDGVQELETEHGPALNYVLLTGSVALGDIVLLNRTARLLNLGTGGFDFVMANISASEHDEASKRDGHIIKARYTPSQHSVLTLEEQAGYADVWSKRLDGFPVLVGQLHSQLAPASSALHQAGAKVAYVMTDGASLAMGFSRLAQKLREIGVVSHTITAGQAFGGEYETITVASALLAAKHILGCDGAIVVQGPGNAGTGTKFGFSGLEQSSHLNTVEALGGTPIAIVRMSNADPRPRHQGISHHTLTSLDMTLAACDVPVPVGCIVSAIAKRHTVRHIESTAAAVGTMEAAGIKATTMGRTPATDPLFFEAAAAAGMFAAKLIAANKGKVGVS